MNALRWLACPKLILMRASSSHAAHSALNLTAAGRAFSSMTQPQYFEVVIALGTNLVCGRVVSACFFPLPLHVIDIPPITPHLSLCMASSAHKVVAAVILSCHAPPDQLHCITPASHLMHKEDHKWSQRGRCYVSLIFNLHSCTFA